MLQTVFYPLLGGALIGLGAAGMLLFNGRIAGIAGIVSGLLLPERGERLWRAVFVAGLLLVGAIAAHVSPDTFTGQFVPPPAVLILSGLLVGFGSRLGNGCTSGHGVCGVSRLSRRSWVATAVFVGSAMLTVAVIPQGWAVTP